jgi:hypothetical protein
LLTTKTAKYDCRGSLTLWLDDVQKQSITFIDNDTRALTDVRLGAQSVESGTRGALYFDDPSTGSGQALNQEDSRTLALSPTPAWTILSLQIKQAGSRGRTPTAQASLTQ